MIFGTIYANIYGMSNTITLGKAGRLVIPKALRETLGLRTGARLRIQISSGTLQMEPVPDNVRIEEDGEFPVIRSGSNLGKNDIVEAIREDRETRDGRITSRGRDE